MKKRAAGVELKPDREAIRASFGTVTFRHGTYSVAAVVLVIIIAIIVNMIAGQLTSAVSKVTGHETKKAYIVSGHGESGLSDSMVSLMTKSAVETEELNLYMTEEIPEDCDMLIFNGPTSDISKGEKNAVDQYIKNGGSVVMLMSEDTPTSGNLTELMESYKITLQEGYVADMERNYLGNYYAIFPEITDSTGTTGELDTGAVMVNNSRAVSLGESSEEVEVSFLMETSDYGYLVSGDEQEEGSFVLAAVAEYMAEAEDEEDGGESADESTDESADDESTDSGEVVNGKLMVFGSQSLIDESITEAFSNLDNTTLFMNSMASMLGDTDNLSIEAKSLEVQYNTVQSGGAVSIFHKIVVKRDGETLLEYEAEEEDDESADSDDGDAGDDADDDESPAEIYAGEVGSIYFDNCVDYYAEDDELGKYGLNRSSRKEVTVTYDDTAGTDDDKTAKVTFYMGSTVEEDDVTYVYIMLADSDMVYKVDASDMEELLAL